MLLSIAPTSDQHLMPHAQAMLGASSFWLARVKGASLELEICHCLSSEHLSIVLLMLSRVVGIGSSAPPVRACQPQAPVPFRQEWVLSVHYSALQAVVQVVLALTIGIMTIIDGEITRC